MSRESRIVDQMDLLGIKDVSTPRQAKNGTVVWQLPIKNNWPGNQANASFIKVASFSTGYVRNQNSGYSNYQLNKRCESEPQYYPDHEWKTLGNGDYTQVKTGKYRKYTTRTCKLIPKEIDRLEYLIGYCLKNYYIKKANEVINGDFIPKWNHEYEMERAQNKMEEICHIEANHGFIVNGLQNKLANSVPKWKYDEAMKLGGYDRIQELETRVTNLSLQNEVLQNKLSNAISVTKYECAKARTERASDKIYELENKLKTISRRLDVTKSIADNG